jgi:hypothetical protein
MFLPPCRQNLYCSLSDVDASPSSNDVFPVRTVRVPFSMLHTVRVSHSLVAAIDC